MLNHLFSAIEDRLKEIWPGKPQSIVGFVFQFIGAVSSLAFILSYFNIQGVAVLDRLAEVRRMIFNYAQLQAVPRVIWLILVVFFFYVISTRRRVNLVAGTFTDDFSHGLVNWEYGGEGWTVQRGEKGYELSVTNSGGGGISNFGLWDSYVFSFECKVVNRNAGWIIRATDRENYAMVQLSLPNENKDYSSINPHFLVQGKWLVIERRLQVSKSLTEKILSHQWLKVKIAVFGNTVDIFLNGERVLNYHIPDPLRIPKEELLAEDTSPEVRARAGKIYEAYSFPAGRVGFRCFGQEHALFRNVKVEPKFWNSKKI